MDGKFTENTAFMRFDSGAWTKTRILLRNELKQIPQHNGTVFGLSVSQTVRISPDDSGGAALFCVKQAITRLNISAQGSLLPMADEGAVLEALMMLVDSQRDKLYDGGRFFAVISLFSADMSLSPYPVDSACLTIDLWYDKSEPSIAALNVCIDRTWADSEHIRGRLAQKNGYDNAVLLDGVYKKYILGLAGSNIFLRTDQYVMTPAEQDAHNGITAGCVIELMRGWGIEVKECRISMDELLRLYSEGRLLEAFATDTLNIVMSIVKISNPGSDIELKKGKLAKKLFDAVRHIERGTYPAPTGWIQRI